MSGLVEAARFSTRVEADLARLHLESQGVDCVLFDTEINQFYGGLFMPVRLMVLEDDADAARRLIEQQP